MEIDKAQQALNKVIQGVVALRVTATRPFDTYVAGVSSGTGFVVDKQRGIILTNSHVVKPGPVVADATFANGKEIRVYPLYVDPVHDFGFFRFDPADLESMTCEEIKLAPEAAAVGLEIRVVGNDSSEKLSIIPGTLAQLDTNARHYSDNGYNDFNTFYIQEAIGSIGGSSGSPIIDCHGQAIGLAAGYDKATCTSFCLPLDRVVRALKILQEFKDQGSSAVHIPRGTLQMTLLHRGFDKARQLGLQRETEKLVRKTFPEETGILVIKSVVPGGPAHKMHLEAGDILVRVNNEIVTHFVKLEALLDNNVGKNVDLEVERGGVSLKITLKVQDLHSITPNYFLEVSGGVIHPLSYQQARNFNLRCGLVYVAERGHMLSSVPSFAIIKRFAGKEITQVQDFISVLSKLTPGARVPLKYVSPKDPHRSKSVLVAVDRHKWYAAPQVYTRDNVTGLWERRPAITSWDAQPQRSLPNGETQPQVSLSDGEATQVSLSVGEPQQQLSLSNGEVRDVSKVIDRIVLNMPYSKAPLVEQLLEPSLVRVSVTVPPSIFIDALERKYCTGTGVVIYHSKTLGIVAVDKHTVPISVSDIVIRFRAYPIEIPGDVLFLHPVHNFALVAYDPAALGPSGAAAVRAAALLPEPALRKDDATYLVGLDWDLQAASRNCKVTDPSVALSIPTFHRFPCYRQINMEVVKLDRDFGDKYSGVLADEQGRVQALWSRFSKPQGTKVQDSGDQNGASHHWNSGYKISFFVGGIPIYIVSKVLHNIINVAEGGPLLINGIRRQMPLIRILEAELSALSLNRARISGLSAEWVRKLEEKDPIKRQVVMVVRCFTGSKGQTLLGYPDMILTINGEPITNFLDVEDACERLDEHSDLLSLKVFHDYSELDVHVGTELRDGFGTTHIVGWCGCILQETPSVVRQLPSLPRERGAVYVAISLLGSPAQKVKLWHNVWIVEVNGIEISDLQTLVNVTKNLQHDEFVVVETIDLSGKPSVVTLQQDLRYWPTWELIFDLDSGTWIRKTVSALGDGY